MRQVKNIADVQIVLNQLLDWQTQMQTQNQNLHQLRITNASPGVNPLDYATVSQLPGPAAATKQNNQHFTIPFSKDGVPVDGDKSVPFLIHPDRVGIPTQVWVAVNGAPTSQATFNVLRNGVKILGVDLILAVGKFSSTSSQFVVPNMQFAAGDIICAVVSVAGNCSQVTVGVVIKRTIPVITQ